MMLLKFSGCVGVFVIFNTKVKLSSHVFLRLLQASIFRSLWDILRFQEGKFWQFSLVYSTNV